jgi:hypothetical protein
MMLMKDIEEIRVIIINSRVCGTVIGSNNGIVGVHLDTGEYIDVPQEALKRIQRRRRI